MKKFLSPLIFPILIPVYSVLYLFSANLGQVPFSVVWRPLIASLVFSGVVILFSYLVIREPYRAGLSAGWLLFLFYTFGHVYNLVGAKALFGIEIGYVKLSAIFAVVALGGVLIILRLKHERIPFANFAGLAVCLFLILSGAQIVYYQAVATQNAPQIGLPDGAQDAISYPDIYYLIPDAYARQDVLFDEFHFDNSEFIRALIQRGFYIPECAYSNYFGTSLSLASSLNMNYLEQLGVKVSEIYTRDAPPELQNFIHHSLVRQELKKLGYDFYTFRGFFPTNDITDAEHYFEVFDDDSQTTTVASLNFEHMYVKSTYLRAFVEYFALTQNNLLWENLPSSAKILMDPDVLPYSSRSYQWYRQHVYTFDKLKEIPDMPGRKFVYGHIYATHQPYVFDSGGNFLWPVDENNFNYIPAVQYVNARMLETVDAILRKSATPPIIIIQADHGMPAKENKNKILHAIYLPENRQLLYPSMTPVNTFRLILNSYFKLDYPLLPDKLYILDEATKTVTTRPASCGPDG